MKLQATMMNVEGETASYSDDALGSGSVDGTMSSSGIHSMQVKAVLLSSWDGLLNINYCCGLFTDYISARAHYSRLRSTIVPSVACQTTEGEYHSTNPFLPTNTL